MSPRSKRSAARSNVSAPLPLPVHFILLPSLLPTKSLTPLLYSFIVNYYSLKPCLTHVADKQNGAPIYLTLLPTHSPHLSLLPLLIALFPTSPLHLIKLFHPSEYSHDLQGNAPFADIWVPLERAKELCRQLGVDRLFWDEKREGVGLLAERVNGAVSWEEDGAICHK